MRIEISWDGVCWVLHVLDEDASIAEDRDFELYEQTVGDVAEAVSDVLDCWEEKQRHEASEEVSDG